MLRCCCGAGGRSIQMKVRERPERGNQSQCCPMSGRHAYCDEEKATDRIIGVLMGQNITILAHYDLRETSMCARWHWPPACIDFTPMFMKGESDVHLDRFS